MSFDPISLLVTGGTALAGGLLASSQADNKNESIESQAVNAQAAAAIQARQLADQRQAQIDDIRLQAAHMQGRLRALTADAGTGFGDTYANLDNSIVTAAARAEVNINRNYANNLAATQIGVQNSIDQLFSQQTNPLLAGVTGGLQGASTGLSLISGFKSLQTPPPEKVKPTNPTRRPIA